MKQTIAQAVIFTERELKIINLLRQQHPEPITTKTILIEALDYQFDPRTNVVHAALCRLRKKLCDIDGISITTGPGGYTLVLEEPFNNSTAAEFQNHLAAVSHTASQHQNTAQH